ncbi:MAG: DUF3291 domain-containing protein [Deltaproteobacteria bacterium]|nr:DUF3291 domain-containing protein [Deltaproteobacteria bacterium]
MRLTLFVVLTLLTGCSVTSPYEGPGFDGDVEPEGTVVAAITHTRIAAGGTTSFSDHLDAIKRQQDVHEGFIGRSLGNDVPTPIRWTLTLWESEESMLRFVTEGAHFDAMLDSSHVIDGVRSAIFTIEADSEEFPPSWERAIEHLEEQSPELPWK